MRLSRPLHRRVGVVLDIDGVLVRGNKPIPGAREALQTLQAAKVPFMFLTNGGGILEEDKTASLGRALGVELDPRQMMLSHTPFRSLVDHYRHDRILVSGMLRSAEVARAYGFTNVVHTNEFCQAHPSLHPFGKYTPLPGPPPSLKDEAPFKAVFIMADPEDWAQDLQLIVDVARSGGVPGVTWSSTTQDVRIFASNPDLLYAAQFPWPRFGQGAFTASLRALFHAVTGRDLEVVQYGKPQRVTYAHAHAVLKSVSREMGFEEGPFDTIYAVGDNPAADVRGANNAGSPWKSVLVRTGVFPSHMENDPIDQARVVCNDVLEFVGRLLKDEL